MSNAAWRYDGKEEESYKSDSDDSDIDIIDNDECVSQVASDGWCGLSMCNIVAEKTHREVTSIQESHQQQFRFTPSYSNDSSPINDDINDITWRPESNESDSDFDETDSDGSEFDIIADDEYVSQLPDDARCGLSIWNIIPVRVKLMEIGTNTRKGKRRAPSPDFELNKKRKYN
uniref:ORF54 n=1 Tax=Malaco herpesvirus 2 TaxID=3031798 RepID=A0AA48P7L8_9VIRU|nr:TPA_asm: ORF54 [Malaco herpesvirus 2]